ncbi:MAG: hypothetical protein PHG98_06880, partial [Bacteroidales bacterium]|nr:hypothetical protein [Bacteroidales bacterium]MDD4068053.1 hypothetical protein [Bacteroidales bacterium]MDD4739658.1 hypothetical protein [Bacteroidales bacterium]
YCIMKKTLFILSLLAVSLFGVSACQEMFDDNGNVNWGDISTETGTCTDSCTGTGTCEGNHHDYNHGGTETGTCSGTQTGQGGGHGHHGQN